ncbi:hypothetical protein FOA52_014755 [Chlamydomonas sp. UWO 241]|nr:hypothetical protein FOA52_014755 [Chlamydomonas sp. UWO 241]
MGSEAALEASLVASVQESLGLLLYDNARFMGERLVASFGSEQNVCLLAICYYQCNQAYRSYHLLKGHTGPQSRYLLAQACMQLGKMNEARDALTRAGDGSVPNGAAGHYLLGRISRLVGRATDAKDHFVRALRVDPLLWCAYDELCALGGDDAAGELCAAAAAAGHAVAASTSAADGGGSMATAAGGGGGGGEESAGTGGGVDSMVWTECGGEASGGHRPFSESTPNCGGGGGGVGGGGMGGGTTGGGGGGLFAGSQWATPSTGGGGGFATPPAGAGAAAAPSAGGVAHPAAAAPSSKPSGAGPYPSTGTTTATATATALSPSFETPVLAAEAPRGPPPPLHKGGGGGGGGGDGGWLYRGGGGGGGGAPGASSLPGPRGAGAGGGAPPGAPRRGGGGGSELQALIASLGGGGSSNETPTVTLAGPGGGGQLGSHAHAHGHPGAGGAGGGAHGLPLPASASSTGGGVGAGGGLHTAGTSPSGGRLNDGEGKVRKVSGRLFQEPSRRSTRLAAKEPGGHLATPSASHGGDPWGGGGGGEDGRAHTGGSERTDMGDDGEVSPSHLHCQNQPDPDHPPGAPTQQQQAHIDAKLWGGGGGGGGARGGGALQQQQQGQGQHPSRAWGTAGAAAAPSSGSTFAAACGWWRPACATPRGVAAALGLLSPLMDAHRHVCMHRPGKALSSLARAHPRQYATAWALCAAGRAHFEQVDYPASASAFESARALDPQRVDGMDLYSTVLWHMKKEVELSYLVQEMQAVDRLSPQAWCVIGNFCSLQKDHEAAVELFQRAVALDPTCAYAYTLAGHEYFASEDYDKALACYRNAVRLDPRHYTAMYGVGQIYFQQEKYDMALVQFKSASLVNPGSSVLHCYTAMALHRQGFFDRALSKVSEAISLDPKNPLARFEKAAILASMEQHELALRELQALETALSFNGSSSDANMIKAAIEKLGVNEEEEEEM